MDRNASGKGMRGLSVHHRPGTVMKFESMECADTGGHQDFLKLALALNVVTIGLEANVRFLDRESPDTASACDIASDLLKYAKQLEILVNEISIRQFGEG